MLHKPFARGVSHLSYVGTDDATKPPVSKLTVTLLAISAYEVVSGKHVLSGKTLSGGTRAVVAGIGLFAAYRISKSL